MATRTKNQNTLAEGEWNVICDQCGFKFKSSDIRKRWDGLMVCVDDWEPRHPLDFIKGREDDPSVPYARPDSTDSAVTTHGNADATITYGTSLTIHEWNTTLDADRDCNVADGTAVSGNRFTIYKTATGGELDIKHSGGGGASIRAIANAVKAVVVIEFNGTSWYEISYTTL